MIEVFLVAIGGFLGAISRFALGQKIQKQFKSVFPFGTLTVNLIGAFLLGLLFSLSASGPIYLLFGVGFMGAFTTFSTFKLDLERLRKNGKSQFFYSYLFISYTFGILFANFGLLIGKEI